MKKQEYIDLGLSSGLSLSQIESVLMRVLQISKEELFKQIDISSRYIYEVQKIFFDLKNGASEEYILETANFYSREFYVDERVLIPRNDTEVLVREALRIINTKLDTSVTNYVDIWTGSACIPVSIVSEMYPLSFHTSHALDIEQAALEVAKKNIEQYTPWKIQLQQSDLMWAIFHDSSLSAKNLFITANLPYIKNGDSENMDKKVVNNEPDSALYGWKDTWFEIYERLIKQCFQLKEIHKIPEISLLIEIWFDQKQYSRSYLQEMWLEFEYFQDSSKIDRVIYIYGF